LTANPEVWSKTVFFYMFDENDGFFDHMVPPTPPQLRAQGISTAGTTNELFTGSATYLHSRAVRPRRARADDHHLALEQGWRGKLPGV
jgi:phospholipase C